MKPPDADAPPAPRPAPLDALVVRVLDALLREDYRGLRSGAVQVAAPELDAGRWLQARYDGRLLLFPVRPGGFLADLVVRRPVLGRRTAAGVELLAGLDAVLDALRPAGDAEAEAGFATFVAECRQAAEVAVLPLPARPPAEAGPGLAGSLRYEALAARLEHPVYPTGRCRLGLSVADLRRYAPEFAPRFGLRWLALPADAAEQRGRRPGWWPEYGDRALLPVHPLTLGRLDEALHTTGLAGTAELLPGEYAEVTPTLSMRTVALTADPTTHVKLPLPTSTLGARNRRSLAPGTLADGDVVRRTLAAILAREPAFADRILLADESCHGHAGHEYLGYLIRRYPAGLDSATVLPLAALPLDPAAADRFGEYLALLIDWHVTLWLRYGMVLESHQQNISLVLDGGPLRLLYRDNDGPRIDHPRLAGALGQDAPEPTDFADRRILAADPDELADVFTTITVHLCAGALAFGLAERGLLDLPGALATIRHRLESAAAAHAYSPAAATLRRRVLDADRLPVKTMVTAGTLLPKHRTGAADINKHYGTTGPNYLLPHHRRSR